MAEKERKYEPIATMSVKKMGCDARDAIKAEGAVYMCRIYGEAVDMKTKESRNGDPYSYFVGTFRAITAEGKAFESEKLFLPGTLAETIEAQLKTSDGAGVQFGWDLFATPDDSLSIGYRYAAKTLLKPEVTERLSALTKAVENMPQVTTEKKSKKEK